MSGTPFPERLFAFRGALHFIRTRINGTLLSDLDAVCVADMSLRTLADP